MSETSDFSFSMSPAEDLEDFYENAPCGFLSMQLDGRIYKANTTLATWTGFNAEQLVGKRFRDLLTIGTRILYETSFEPLLSLNGAMEEASLDLRTAEGETLPVFVSGAARQDAQGDRHSIRIVMVKASNRRRYERQLVDAHTLSQKLETATQRLLDAERETSELREQFIAVLGHDLRNPLASITGGTRMLQKDQTPERRKLIFGMIQGSILRMEGLINNVLDFARGRLGSGIPLEFRSDVLLTPVLDHVVWELRTVIPDCAIETDFDLPRPIRCDPSRIAQLVSNLLGNALTHGAPEHPVRIRAFEADDGLVISIANGGAAIPDGAMERLFQPFFRGEVRASQQGLGLGLHIASEIAKAHGGTLGAISTSEETRFTFQMPTGI